LVDGAVKKATLAAGELAPPEAGVRRLRRSLKTSEIIARDIVREIADRGLQSGAALPHETTMMAQYGVGRASIREALRILEAQGLIFLKPGRNGGPVLAQTGPEQLGNFLTLFLRLSGATYGDLADFMITVSPHLAELAAQNPDRDQVRQALSVTSRNPCALVDLPITDNVSDFGPHAMINRLSGNPVLTMFADAVDTVFASYSLALTRAEDFLDIAEAEHRAIADAVVAGKPVRARRLMAEHIRHIMDYNRAKAPGIFAQKIEWK
jgi:GntR family transcriptional repressor for pyruvate dehydrogenase complex